MLPCHIFGYMLQIVKTDQIQIFQTIQQAGRRQVIFREGQVKRVLACRFGQMAAGLQQMAFAAAGLAPDKYLLFAIFTSHSLELADDFGIIASKKTIKSLVALKFKLKRHLHERLSGLFSLVNIKTGAKAQQQA